MKTRIFAALLASVSSPGASMLGVSTLVVSTLAIFTQAVAQNKSDLTRSIDDDGRSLFIRVSGCVNGRVLNFEKKLDVRGWSSEEKLAATDAILDSLAVGRISLSADDDRSKGKRSRERSEYSYAREKKANLDVNRVTVSRDDQQSVSGAVSSPLNKEVWTDENGFLYIRFKIMRGKDEFIFEKSTEAKGMTESGKQKFIRDFEKELEMPVM